MVALVAAPLYHARSRPRVATPSTTLRRRRSSSGREPEPLCADRGFHVLHQRGSLDRRIRSVSGDGLLEFTGEIEASGRSILRQVIGAAGEPRLSRRWSSPASSVPGEPLKRSRRCAPARSRRAGRRLPRSGQQRCACRTWAGGWAASRSRAFVVEEQSVAGRSLELATDEGQRERKPGRTRERWGAPVRGQRALRREAHGSSLRLTGLDGASRSKLRLSRRARGGAK